LTRGELRLSISGGGGKDAARRATGGKRQAITRRTKLEGAEDSTFIRSQDKRAARREKKKSALWSGSGIKEARVKINYTHYGEGRGCRLLHKKNLTKERREGNSPDLVRKDISFYLERQGGGMRKKSLQDVAPKSEEKTTTTEGSQLQEAEPEKKAIIGGESPPRKKKEKEGVYRIKKHWRGLEIH